MDIPRAAEIMTTAGGKAKYATQKRSTLPSCVYYQEDKNYEPLVGDFEKNIWKINM